MSGSQRALRIISIVLIVLAIISILFGAFLALGSFLPGVSEETYSYGGEDLNVQALAIGMGLAVIIPGVVDLIIGILGLRGAKDPDKIMPFFVLCIIGAVLSLIGIGMTVAQGTFTPSTLASFVIIVVCLILANKIREQAKR